jgi:hypothetical protein
VHIRGGEERPHLVALDPVLPAVESDLAQVPPPKGNLAESGVRAKLRRSNNGDMFCICC